MINLFVRFHSRYVSFIHSLTNNCIDQTTYTFSSLKKRKPNDFFYILFTYEFTYSNCFYRKTIQIPFFTFSSNHRSHTIPLHEILCHTFPTRSKVQNNIFSKLPSFLPLNPLKILLNRLKRLVTQRDSTTRILYAITTNGLLLITIHKENY